MRGQDTAVASPVHGVGQNPCHHPQLSPVMPSRTHHFLPKRMLLMHAGHRQPPLRTFGATARPRYLQASQAPHKLARFRCTPAPDAAALLARRPAARRSRSDAVVCDAVAPLPSHATRVT
eukprot:6204876-Pleurochrysis_carterae.AAC.4